MYKYTPTITLLLAAEILSAQPNTIPLKNGSFEDFPQVAHAPSSWHDCGFPGETPPDVLPHPAFQVTGRAQQGNTYLGLVTRDNETYEGVSQKLLKPLEKDHCYDFSIWASRAKNYVSLSITSGNLENFNKAVKIIVWGGNSDCDKRESLYESKPIENTNWEQLAMKLKPTKSTYAYIFIEAYYVRKMVPYNGNVLLDNASAIVEDITCTKPLPKDTPVLVAVVEKKIPKNPKPKPEKGGNLVVKVEGEPKNPSQVATATTPKETRMREAKSFDKIDVSRVTVNDRFNMNSVLFEIDSYAIKESSYEQLDKLVEFLKGNTKVIIEVGGHTNSNPDFEFANELSTNRANAVADYLRGKGVDDSQIRTHGYGKSYPIATNETDAGKRQNQRVEVKIIKINR